MLFKKKKTTAKSFDERVQEATLNGAVATSVFEAAASELDASARELAKLSAEAEHAAEGVLDRALIEADALHEDAERLTFMAHENTARANRILAVVGA